ncbi:hypothetical protein Scep_019516 [Stephania cephalantha]|uniref:Uncharacterized protein n=1 Tax=Stephania cephalantha TaxID=152367 RepID=A0AAP0NLF5_9MAGN
MAKSLARVTCDSVRVDGCRIYLQPSRGIRVVLMCNNIGKGPYHLLKLGFSHCKPVSIYVVPIRFIDYQLVWVRILQRARARARRYWVTTSEIVEPACVLLFIAFGDDLKMQSNQYEYNDRLGTFRIFMRVLSDKPVAAATATTANKFHHCFTKSTTTGFFAARAIFGALFTWQPCLNTWPPRLNVLGLRPIYVRL